MTLCDRRTTELLMSDSLSLEQTAQFEDHLAECTTCQAMLVEVAGGKETLDAAAAMLASSTELPQWNDSQNSHVGTGCNELSSSSHSVDLSILGPTDDPASMGRIGNYEIQGIIGRGGMGIVFRALDSALSRNVALKVLDPSLASIAAARKRFAMEARAMAAISHEHVVPVYTVDEHRGLPYFAMEYVPGGTLESRIRKQGPLDCLAILRISRQIALALSAAHECGLVHRDIKPANILLDRGVERVRVADFGLARVNSDASHTRSGFIAGTPQYMAPEQVRGETCSPQSDLFSLGTVMYAMCTGHSPFRSESMYGSMQRIVHEAPRSIREQAPAIPEWLEGFILKLLSKNTLDRFPDAMTVATLLEAEAAHAENPAQFGKPQRIGYLTAVESHSFGVSQWVAIVTTLAATAAFVVWLTSSPRPAAETLEQSKVEVAGQTVHANVHESNDTIANEIANDDEFVVGEKSIRDRATQIEQSYRRSDPLPVVDPLTVELRQLKQQLEAFEKQNP